MESNNKNNKNYGEEQQQLRGSARKRKFNESANDGHGQRATEEEQKQQVPPENFNKKNRGQGNDALEVCNFYCRLKIIGILF
jgi:hypothetical protein